MDPSNDNGSDSGSILTCWPSKGGIYRLSNVHNVQRQFLGFDRCAANLLRPEVSADVEDAFCNQLQKLGARWWKSESQYGYEFFGDLYTGRPAQDRSALYIGWPASGGVWALSTDFRDAAKEGYGVIYNSLTMEEQCEMIEEFGGTFYQDPKDCPYLDLPENETTPS
ncbi:hypothetical protein MKX08_002153 [Trichoderma sp. CBMAI-0020]|nr:hypothetical protein MKX08_002153 [Trichoderma sp. CBMAI-0020]WOD46527.1 hypothetical protein [Trichoderma atroviride]